MFNCVASIAGDAQFVEQVGRRPALRLPVFVRWERAHLAPAHAMTWSCTPPHTCDPLCTSPRCPQVAARYPALPLFPNLRCGLWYVRPPIADTCYFKSTDGHNNNWCAAGMGRTLCRRRLPPQVQRYVIWHRPNGRSVALLARGLHQSSFRRPRNPAHLKLLQELLHSAPQPQCGRGGGAGRRLPRRRRHQARQGAWACLAAAICRAGWPQRCVLLQGLCREHVHVHDKLSNPPWSCCSASQMRCPRRSPCGPRS